MSIVVTSEHYIAAFARRARRSHSLAATPPMQSLNMSLAHDKGNLSQDYSYSFDDGMIGARWLYNLPRKPPTVVELSPEFGHLFSPVVEHRASVIVRQWWKYEGGNMLAT